MHARLEVAIAGKHAGGDQIMLAQDVFNLRIERAGIADASCAAIPHKIKAQLI